VPETVSVGADRAQDTAGVGIRHRRAELGVVDHFVADAVVIYGMRSDAVDLLLQACSALDEEWFMVGDLCVAVVGNQRSNACSQAKCVISVSYRSPVPSMAK
jgi:hypothetical protein